jgi:xanthine dehydrogenase molybdopterin-binding subunit B
VQVGFNKDGVIQGLDLDIYNNAGCSLVRSLPQHKGCRQRLRVAVCTLQHDVHVRQCRPCLADVLWVPVVVHQQDLSSSIMDRALLHTDNGYRLGKAVSLRGHICKTNQASNTAFRGFGGPQGTANTLCDCHLCRHA